MKPLGVCFINFCSLMVVVVGFVGVQGMGVVAAILWWWWLHRRNSNQSFNLHGGAVVAVKVMERGNGN